jgi:VCBS repeat protein/ASPIC/UnbV protein
VSLERLYTAKPAIPEPRDIVRRNRYRAPWTVSTLVIAAVVIYTTASLGTDDVVVDRPEVTNRSSGEAFVDVTTGVGIPNDRVHRSWGAAWGDYDGNGWPDVFVSHHTGHPLLLRNLEGRYSQVEMQSPISQPFDRHGCAWGEANGDGRPDFFCTRGAQHGQGKGPKKLFIQTADGFVDRANAFGVHEPFGRGRTVNWLDYDTDGDLDLFLGNKHRKGHPNAMFKNEGVRYKRVNVGVNEELSTINSTWGDWDNDGDPDLLVLQYGSRRPVAYENQSGRFRRKQLGEITRRPWKSAAWGDYNGDGWIDLHLMRQKRSVVLKNTHGRFTVRHRLGLTAGRMSSWLDVDNDTDLDLFVIQGAPGRGDVVGANRPDFMLINQGNAGFTKESGAAYRGPRTGNGDSVSVADHNRDGLVDIFVTNGFGQQQGAISLFENHSTSNLAAGLNLRGSARNPWGMGARIRVKTPDNVYRRQLTDGFNYRSQNEVGFVHVGLAQSSEAEVRILWPDGVVDCLMVAAGSVTVLRRGDHPC